MESAIMPNNLKRIKIRLHESEQCISDFALRLEPYYNSSNTTFGFKTIPSQKWICASGEVPHEQGACYGDSGGPLMKQNTKNGEG